MTVNKGSVLEFIFRLCTGICIILGVVVLIGWHSKSPILIQVLPLFAPMQYNAALSFLLCGIFLLLVRYNNMKIAAVPGTIVALIGSLTLAEYLGGYDLYIDELFMDYSISVRTSQPGRMAPNTALCFLLAAIAGRLSIGNIRNVRLSGILGSLIFGLGVVAFVGYIVQLEVAYGWGAILTYGCSYLTWFYVHGCRNHFAQLDQ